MKKIDFLKYFLIFFSKILNLGSPNTPFRTSTVDRKKLQFLRSENIHKKEKHAATYDVVRARPSCIWKARWSVVSLRENQSFSKWMLKHRLICTYLLQQHMTRLCRYREVVSEMLQKNQKMAYVQKLYNSVYMHMRCCSEDLRYVTLKMLGNASKTNYLRNIFRFFSDAHFVLTFFWLLFDFSQSKIDFLSTIYVYIQYEHTLFFGFSGTILWRSHQEVNQKSTKSLYLISKLTEKVNLDFKKWFFSGSSK